jgi:hypothetical protein
MKKILALGILVLCCCLAAAAQSQTPSNPERDQSGEAAANPPAAGDAISGTDWLRGCLSQSPDGSFTLADDSGHNFQLQGNTSKLNSYVGKEVQLHGARLGSAGTNTSAMSSDASNASGYTGEFKVSNVQKISDTCK